MADVRRRRSLPRAAALAAVMVGLGSAAEGQAARAAEWYFYVQNNTSSTITRLEVKEKGGSWGRFQLGGGIEAGERSRIEWAASTNDQDCRQSIRATFADGSTSAPTVFDFCDDLDTPIVFSE